MPCLSQQTWLWQERVAWSSCLDLLDKWGHREGLGKYRFQSSVEIMINETFHLRRSELWIRDVQGKHTCLAPTPDWLYSHLFRDGHVRKIWGGPWGCEWSHLYAWRAGIAEYLEVALWQRLNDPNHAVLSSILLARPSSLMGIQRSIPQWGIADPPFGQWIFHLLQFGGSLCL